MRRIRITIQALIGATAIVGGMAALTPAAQAATPVACSETALVAAINLANSNPGADTLVLAAGCTYTLTSAHGGPANGLPVITTPIEMIGPATITRASGQLFRIAEVSPTGKLTLTTGVALTNGSVVGDGGGVLNHGAVTLTGSSLSGNTATGNGGGLANTKTSGTAPAATFTNSPVSNNTALLNGGGLANADTSGTGPAATFTNSPVTGNKALAGNGGGLYNGQNDTLTTTGVSGSPLFIKNNTAGLRGGGIAAVNSTATTLTQTAVTVNTAGITAGGVYRQGGTMTTTNSPITANIPNNCVGSAPAVPTCTA
jgi:predicted outer membrane repeat protein